MCSRGRGETFFNPDYAVGMAGDMLPQEPLISEVESLVMELEIIRAKSKGMVH
jgi:hypothetical protein